MFKNWAASIMVEWYLKKGSRWGQCPDGRTVRRPRLKLRDEKARGDVTYVRLELRIEIWRGQSRRSTQDWVPRDRWTDRQLWRLQRVHSEFPLSTDHQCMPVRKRCMAGQRATCQVQKTQSWKPHSTRNISCSPNPGWKILSFTEHEESN